MTELKLDAAGLLDARATHLEMLALPAMRVPMPLGPKLAVLRARDIPLSFYRYIYEQVGKPSHWLKHRLLDDEALSAVVHAETTEIRILYVDGCPAGFFELDFSRMPAEVELLYFGLVPDYQGRGLAKFLLSEAIFAAFSPSPERVVIQTCTLDNPRALQLYQRAGFSPYAFSQEKVLPWL